MRFFKPKIVQNKTIHESYLPIKQRLKIEFFRRVTVGIPGTIATVLVVFWFFGRTATRFQYWGLTATTLIGIAFFRYALKFLAKNDPDKIQKFYPAIVASSILLSATWGISCALFTYTYGGQHELSLLYTLVVFSMAFSATYVVASDIVVQYAFFLLTVGPPTLEVFIYEKHTPLAAFYIILFVYLLSAGKQLRKNLFQTLELENNLIEEDRKLKEQTRITLLEKNKLQEIIDFVPGFVALCDYDGNWLEKSKRFHNFQSNKKLNSLKEKFLKSDFSELTEELEIEINGTKETYALNCQKISQDINKMIMVGVPITEIKKLQKMAESERSKAEYSARLATLGEMAGGVAHEINNPLSIIVGKMAILKKRVMGGENDPQILLPPIQLVSDTADRIAKIVRGLRTFSRNSEQDPMSEEDLGEIIEQTLDLCQERFKGHGIDFRIHYPKNTQITCRPAQISQVLMNLLNNAYDAVENLAEKWVDVSVDTSSSNTIRILVTDSGHGISPEIEQKLMQPFFTTKELGKGTGLGLSISDGIIREHKGSLYYDRSSPHTRFVIELPAAQPQKQVA